MIPANGGAMDPYTAAFNAAGEIAKAAAGGPAVSQAALETGAAWMDGAGWTVATGGGSSKGGTTAGGMGAAPPWLWIALACAAGLMLWRMSK